MSASPVFVGTPRTAMVQISTANTARDGSGTVATVWSAGASGSRIDRVKIMGVGTVTGGMVRLFLNDGTNTRLLDERPIAATTPSATVPGFIDEIPFPDGLVIQSGWSLKAATHNAETFNVFAQGGDL